MILNCKPKCTYVFTRLGASVTLGPLGRHQCAGRKPQYMGTNRNRISSGCSLGTSTPTMGMPCAPSLRCSSTRRLQHGEGIKGVPESALGPNDRADIFILEVPVGEVFLYPAEDARRPIRDGHTVRAVPLGNSDACFRFLLHISGQGLLPSYGSVSFPRRPSFALARDLSREHLSWRYPVFMCVRVICRIEAMVLTLVATLDS
jgi:hypothetical protein